MTLTLCKPQQLDDVVLTPRGKQGHLSQGSNEEDGGKSNEYEFNRKHLHGKA